jgi:DNA-binding ferritin-like protein
MNLSSNVNLFLGVLAQLKIFHWQTKGYARHNAFGSTIDAIDGLVDDFVEEAMGQYGRFTLDDETNTIQLANLSDLKPIEMINTICDALIQISDQLDPKDTNLLNLRDEILGKFQKLKYLLTLE